MTTATRSPLVDPRKADVVRLLNGAHCVASLVNWRHITKGATVVEVGS